MSVNRFHRQKQWNNSPRVGARFFECSIPRCQDPDLRETSDGIFCRRHYLTLSECSMPGCTRVSSPDKYFNPRGLCRHHMMECDEFNEESRPRNHSMIATIGEYI